ncbi:MAG TPA: hypothetical protein VN112_15805, partial [Ensifer sp.]|nr:hypothetical protein [Ensifer sp.]
MPSQTVLARARNLILEAEGFIEHMYLDTVSQITIGYGTMLPTAASSTTITMLNKATNQPATVDEKVKAWNTLREFSPVNHKLNMKAEAFADMTDLVINELQAERLFNLKLGGFVSMLQKHYPKFEDFPEDAQIAILDMAYNLGPRIYTVFKSFTKAVNDPRGPQ